MNHDPARKLSLAAVVATMILTHGSGGCSGSTSSTASSAPSYPACSAATEECVDQLGVGSGLSLSFNRNFSLTAPNAAITRAILVVHGASRDAAEYYYTVETASEQAGESDTTLVVAPRFECSDDSPPSGTVYWQCSGDDWSHGFADASGAEPPIYSYAVVDQIITLLADKHTFPNLAQVVVTGLGSGGQLTQRYAATNAIDPVAGVGIQYLVVGPSSYVYLDADRPAVDTTCSAEGCTGSFTPYWDASSCSSYDQYYYGIEGRSGYVGVPSAATLQAQYVARDVTIAVGSEDTLANAAGTGLDTSCGANAQGVDRVARALGFWNRVHTQYGAKHQLSVVPGCMSSRTCMYFSPELRGVLFPAAN